LTPPNNFHAANLLGGCAPGLRAFAGLCSCRRACDSDRFSLLGQDRRHHPLSGEHRNGVRHGQGEGDHASRAHRVHLSSSGYAPTLAAPAPLRIDLSGDYGLATIIDLNLLVDVLDHHCLTAAGA
jgi:hypothetical protein